MNKLKDQFKNLEVGSVGAHETAKPESSQENAMSKLIGKTGENLRQQVSRLEEERLEKEQSGQTLVPIPIDAIDRPDALMRSSRFWKTEKYQTLKERIANEGLNDEISVRPGDKEGRYILIKGDTRLHVFEELYSETGNDKWFCIPSRIQPVDANLAVMMMVSENRDRNDVPPIDEARFHARICEEYLNGDRAAAMELLHLTEGGLSKNLTAARLPDDLLDAFPSLYEAGIRSLYPLVRTIEANPERLPDVLDEAEALQEDSPSKQANRLQRAFVGSEKKISGTTSGSGMVSGTDGRVIARVERNRKTTALKIDNQSLPGFAEYVESQLENLYQNWSDNKNPDTASE